MNALTIANTADMTMSSQEIAELTGKEHRNVMRDIRAMLVELHGEGGVLSFEHTLTNPQNGQTYPVFNLPKRETLILVSGYNVQMRAAIIDRWQELEAKPVSNVIALPNFSNPALAARAWAEQFEARIAAEAKKAEIGSRREATAMNTASLAVKKANKLAIELDKSMQYATVKRMEMLYHGQSFNWRLLKSTAIQMNIPPTDVFDANYGTVKAYHADVWREAFALEINTEPMEKSA
jgi:Rha family phage regulatory protein